MDGPPADQGHPPHRGAPPSTRASAAGLAGLYHMPHILWHNQPTTNQQHNMQTQPSVQQSLNRSGFLCLACGFADFAQSRRGPPTRRQRSVGLERFSAVSCFVLLSSLIIVCSAGVYLPRLIFPRPIWCNVPSLSNNRLLGTSQFPSVCACTRPCSFSFSHRMQQLQHQRHSRLPTNALSAELRRPLTHRC